MSARPPSKLEQTRAEIETLLRQFQGWGLAILEERKAELERSLAESGAPLAPPGALPDEEAEE